MMMGCTSLRCGGVLLNVRERLSVVGKWVGWVEVLCTSQNGNCRMTSNVLATEQRPIVREENIDGMQNGTENGGEGQERKGDDFYGKRMHDKGGLRTEDNSKA